MNEARYGCMPFRVEAFFPPLSLLHRLIEVDVGTSSARRYEKRQDTAAGATWRLPPPSFPLAIAGNDAMQALERKWKSL